MTTIDPASPAPARPTFDRAARLAELEAAEPIERARMISELSRELGTLPPELARLRRETLRELRTVHRWKAKDIARALGLSPARVPQLTGRLAPAPQLATEAPS